MSRLHRAARMGKYGEVAECLAQGEDVNAISIHHFSALMLAAREGHLEIVMLLLKAGADVRLTHPNGRTALHFAASAGRLTVVQALVAHGVDVDALSKTGCTPAIEAAQFNHREVVMFLQARGADMTLRNRQGRTADDYLEQGGVFGHAMRLFPEESGTSDNLSEHRLARAGAEAHVLRLMAEGLSADEFAAKHGRRILVWSYGYYRFRDSEVEQWAHRVSEVLFTPGLLDICEEQFLQGEELADARKCRTRRARRSAKASV
jgi:hypothetical protein